MRRYVRLVLEQLNREMTKSFSVAIVKQCTKNFREVSREIAAG